MSGPFVYYCYYCFASIGKLSWKSRNVSNPIAPCLRYNLVVHYHLLICPYLHESYPDLVLKKQNKVK